MLLCSQVTELSPEEAESTTGGYAKSISHVIIGLKSVKGTKQLKLEPSVYDALIKEKVPASLPILLVVDFWIKFYSYNKNGSLIVSYSK